MSDEEYDSYDVEYLSTGKELIAEEVVDAKEEIRVHNYVGCPKCYWHLIGFEHSCGRCGNDLTK